MKLYLSSFKIGNEAKKLIEMTEKGNKKVAFVNNALDFATDIERRRKSDQMDILGLEKLGFSVDILDLKLYFIEQKSLEEKLDDYDVIWVRGGNTFVLAQAMKLSGLDRIIKSYYKSKKDIVYGGYSAGICILTPTLKGIHLVDDPHIKPYGEHYETVWAGLGVLNYSLAPHYQSDHPESNDIDKAIDYMIQNKIPFKALKDGEVLIIE